jgi:hypothetical protein
MRQPKVISSSATIAANPTLLVSGNSGRIALRLVNIGTGPILAGPLDSMILGGGMIVVQQGETVDMLFTDYGPVIGYQWFIFGTAGDKMVANQLVI